MKLLEHATKCYIHSYSNAEWLHILIMPAPALAAGAQPCRAGPKKDLF